MGNRKNLTSKIKADIVLSSLRGEDLEFLSRAHGVSISDISGWREEFIENGITGFKRKPDDSRISKAERLIGQLQMELELVKKKNELVSKLRKK